MADPAAKLAAWRARRAAAASGATSPVEPQAGGAPRAPAEVAPLPPDREAQPVSSYARPLRDPPAPGAEVLAGAAHGGAPGGLGGTGSAGAGLGVGGEPPGDREAGGREGGGARGAEPDGARGGAADASLELGDAGTCRSCGAAVRWIVTPNDKRMPLDVEPIEVLTDEDLARARFLPPRADEWRREPILYRLSELAPDQEHFERRVVPFGGHRAPAGAAPGVPRTKGLRSHFVTCEFANQHRRTR